MATDSADFKASFLAAALFVSASPGLFAQQYGWAATPISDAQSMVAGGGAHPAVLIVNRFNRPVVSARSAVSRHLSRQTREALGETFTLGLPPLTVSC